MKETVNEKVKEIRLTQFSHGAGCGCKISPVVLDKILGGVTAKPVNFPQLLVGNADRDDAAVMDLGDGTAIISTTDFFMPIVDDPVTFGKIASANAISDIYAMGGTPLMAIAILGWPVNKLPPELATSVVEGAQVICSEAGIPLAGGHSIDSPEPIFGLAVTGRVSISNLKKNGGAREGDLLFLSKPLGTGILSTAQKKGMLSPAHEELSVNNMIRLNSVGIELGKLEGVHAMTDVTGFGLGGHLIEMCRASDTSAVIQYSKIPLIDPSVKDYIKSGNIPGGTGRNLDSYGMHVRFSVADQRFIICDPQTSGGLLIAADPASAQKIASLLRSYDLEFEPIGMMEKRGSFLVRVVD